MSPAAVNSILEPFLSQINDHSGASTNSLDFSAQILASLPRLVAAGPFLSTTLLTLANPSNPSSAFAPVLRFLGPNILTSMGFNPAEINVFICWTGIKFYVAEAAKAGLRALTDPGTMYSALAPDPAAQRQAFRSGSGPSPSFRGQNFSEHLDALTCCFAMLTDGQDPAATEKAVPAGLLLQDLRADLQTTLIVRHSIGRSDQDTISFTREVVQCLTVSRLKFNLDSISQVRLPLL